MNFLLRITISLLPVVLLLSGCKTNNYQRQIGTPEQSSDIYPSDDSNQNAQQTLSVKSFHPNATDKVATLFVMLTEGAGRNPSTTPYKSLTPTPVTPSPTITPTPYYLPKWEMSQEDANFALIVLDYQSLDFIAGYFEVHKSCVYNAEPVSEETLVTHGYDILNMTYPDFSPRYGEPLNFPHDCSPQKIGDLVYSAGCSIQYIGDFALLEINGDVGGAVVFDACTGQELWAGRLGMGAPRSQIYPIHPIDPSAFELKPGGIRQPLRLDVITSPDSTDVEGYNLAWDSVQSFNLIYDFSTYSYNVFIYLYAPFIYEFNPEEAEWLIFLAQPNY